MSYYSGVIDDLHEEVAALKAELATTKAALEAARVAVEKVSLSDTDDHHCIENLDPVTRACLRCVASHSLAEARRVLGLEVRE